MTRTRRTERESTINCKRLSNRFIHLELVSSLLDLRPKKLRIKSSKPSCPKPVPNPFAKRRKSKPNKSKSWLKRTRKLSWKKRAPLERK